MIKKFILAIFILVVVVGIIAGIKAMQIERMIEQGAQFQMPPEVVTAATVEAESWENLLRATGSLAAVQGVDITAELPGKIVDIAFKPGTKINVGDLLIQQDISTEQADLRAAEANVALAELNLKRSRKLLAERTIPQSDYDTADARLKEARARADAIRASIAKKTIRAPFSGRLGVRQAHLGQMLSGGETIVSLQSLDPILVNFYLPQQLARVETGYLVRVTTDTLPGEVLEGEIAIIHAKVDNMTRNLLVQAVLSNADELLRPGMFVNVEVVLPNRIDVLAVPTTSVLYAPYGDSVFVVEDAESGDGQVLRQQLVRLGEKRGDFVAVVSGLNGGESVVSTGVFKYRHGQAVVVDNTHAPPFQHDPSPQN